MENMLRLRRILTEAQVTNVQLGHENQGFLSAQHGFLPSSPPLQSLPESHRLWDEIAAQLPELISTLTLRRVVDKLPLLASTADQLPDRYLCRAALLLCNIAHAYYWVEVGFPKTPLNNIIKPWTQVSQRLERPHPSLLSLDVLYNWRLRDSARLDPLRVDNIEVLASVTGVREEYIEYQTALELMMQTIPVVAAVVRAQEAVVVNSMECLQQELLLILERIEHVTEVTYPKIDLNPHSVNYVNPSMWGKVAGGGYFSGPIHSDELGMSGAGYPIFSLMDIFLGRKIYTSKKGQEAMAVRHWYPQHLHRFFSELEKISVRDFVLKSGNQALQNVFQQLLDAYAGDKGFLGVHRLKTYGFMEVGFKTGRAVTNGGFKSLNVFKEKTWDAINDELEIARNERYIGLPTHCNFATPKKSEALEAGPEQEIKQIYFDITGTDIRYQPGDRCGILPENSDELINKTIRALQANPDTLIELHLPWQAALRLRADYKDRETDTKIISLYAFLKFGKIRPITRIIAKRIYAITAAASVGRVLHARAEDQWELWDLLDLLSKEGFDVQRFWRAKPWENEAICRVIPPEALRMYSIASASPKNQDSSSTLQLTVGKLSYPTQDSNVSKAGKRSGTASSYLHRLMAQTLDKSLTKIPVVSLRVVPAPRFRLPADTSRPIVMFSAGTGIAPFIGFVEERVRQKASENWLFFSTRSHAQFHRQQWFAAMIAAKNLNLNVAFSREDISARFVSTYRGGKLVFEYGKRGRIDSLMLAEKNSLALWELLRTRQHGGKEAFFYICGKTAFAATVMQTLKEVVRKYSGDTEEKINLFIYQLNADRRLMMDVFTTYNIPENEERQTFAATEVAEHNNQEAGYWILINGRVYNLTEFIQLHPGGHQTLLLHCGLDASQAYRSVGHASDSAVDAMLGMYEIGVIKRLDFGETSGFAIGPEGPFYISLDEVFRVWVRYLYLIVEMQNALKIDFSFLQEATTAYELKDDFSLFKMQLFIQAQKRFNEHCLDVLSGEDLQALWAVTSGLCDRKSDVRWIQQQLVEINAKRDVQQAKKGTDVLQKKLDSVKNDDTPINHISIDVLAALEISCTQIIQKNEQVLTALKLVISDGVKIFEQYESQASSIGNQILIQHLMRIPSILQTHYEQLWHEVIEPYDNQMEKIADEGVLHFVSSKK